MRKDFKLFGRTRRLELQLRGIRPERNQQAAGNKQSREEGDEILLRHFD
jgi:hypothetical protein